MEYPYYIRSFILAYDTYAVTHDTSALKDAISNFPMVEAYARKHKDNVLLEKCGSLLKVMYISYEDEVIGESAIHNHLLCDTKASIHSALELSEHLLVSSHKQNIQKRMIHILVSYYSGKESKYIECDNAKCYAYAKQGYEDYKDALCAMYLVELLMDNYPLEFDFKVAYTYLSSCEENVEELEAANRVLYYVLFAQIYDVKDENLYCSIQLEYLNKAKEAYVEDTSNTIDPQFYSHIEHLEQNLLKRMAKEKV